MSHYDTFIQALNEKRFVKVTFNSFEKWTITRTCVPFDFWPSRIYKDWLDRFHFYDLDSPDDKKHNLPILPEQLLEIVLLDDTFEPETYITWNKDKIKWFIRRDWGEYSWI